MQLVHNKGDIKKLASFCLWVIYIFKICFRSEQDKEPEQEVVSETLGAGASEESTVDGKGIKNILLLLNINLAASLNKFSILINGFFVCFTNCANIFHLSAPQEIDEYELVDPVDILTPLDKSGFWDGVVSSFSYVVFCLFYMLVDCTSEILGLYW